MKTSIAIKRKLSGIILIVLLVVLSSGNNRLPRIFIIGDSISIGYTPFVKEYYKDIALVEHNPGNAGDSGRGLENIRKWLGEGDWDIIQINWGLWDLCYRHPDSKLYGNRDKINGTLTFTIDEYKANLDSIVTIIQDISDAELIFVTTTYVPENEAGRYAKDVKKYNKAAKEVMKKHSVSVNDIYKESISIHKKHGIGNDDVHYNEEGNKKLAELIIEYLNKEMEQIHKK
ncbi:hypothetical protein ES708_10023 [subsurface metagenome]